MGCNVSDNNMKYGSILLDGIGRFLFGTGNKVSFRCCNAKNIIWNVVI